MAGPSSGTLTFVFTDVEGSTELLRRLRDDYPAVQRSVRVYQALARGLDDRSPPLREAKQDEPEAAPDLRAADADRDATVAALREHTVAGRLTLEEFSERTGRAYAASTLAQLEEIRRDLPDVRPAVRQRRRPRRFTAVIFGDTERTGRWRLPRLSLAFVFLGNVDLDLRQAEVSGPVASLTAIVLFGNIDLYVPEGIEVDLGGLAVIGHRREWGPDVEPLPGTPLLRVHIFSLFGTADLWRVPASWVGRSFGEVIRALRRGEHHELPPGG